MKVEKLIEILGTAENLKNNTRHAWTSSGRHESVAEHSWRAALMAYFMKDEFPEADINKVILMCLFHDMGEAFTGDIPSFDKSEEDEHTEEEILFNWVRGLPEPYNKELAELYSEMKEQKTEEAKIYKAIDKMEALVQHNESDFSTWIPVEYTLNFIYGREQTEFSEYMKELRRVINDTSEKKLAENDVHIDRSSL